jgi:Putative ATP-dependent Lon protease
MNDPLRNRGLPRVDEVPIDDLDRRLLDAFAGRVVRKDLVKKLNVGFNVPVYVLEYLLGKFCSTTNQGEIESGLRQVKETISERIVRADQGELIKARLQKQGSIKIIDLCTVTFDEKHQGGSTGRASRQAASTSSTSSRTSSTSTSARSLVASAPTSSYPTTRRSSPRGHAAVRPAAAGAHPDRERSL